MLNIFCMWDGWNLNNDRYIYVLVSEPGESYLTRQKGTFGCNQVQDFENGKLS